MTPSTARRRFAIFLPFTVLFLIFFGALVTSHGAGLSVPDWPTTFGRNMFLYPISGWVGGIFYEHGHRLIASVVGFLTLVLAVWIGSKEPRKIVKSLAALALFAVMLQGLLGGLTVRYNLPTPVSVSHAVLGQTFFVITIIIAYFHSGEHFRFRAANNPEAKQLFNLSLFVIALIYLQLIVGAIMRHSGSGLAIPDFPTMGGEWLPLVTQDMLNHINQLLPEMGLRTVSKMQVVVHLLHRIGAVLVSAAVMYLLYSSYQRAGKIDHKLVRNASWLGGLIFVQVFFGVATVLTKKLPYLTSVHVALGALLLGLTDLFSLRAHALSRATS